MQLIPKRYTLVFIEKSDKILLGYKKRGFGEKFWAGYGGKMEAYDADAWKSAKRELQEESKLDIEQHDLHYLGDIVANQDDEKRIVHIFTVTLETDCEIEPEETEEMRPGWFKLDQIPYGEMFQDYGEWLPLVLDKRYFNVEFTLSHGNSMEKVRKQVFPCQPDINNLNF